VTVDQDDRSALALSALAEVTEPASVGELLQVDELDDGVRNLVFACRLPGYRDWRWTVSTAQMEDADPTVLEVELLPADGALLAPPWVPWAERLAEYRRTHPDEAVGADEDDLDEDELDDADLDESDDDALELDGVEFEDPQDEDVEDDGLEDDGSAEPADDAEEEASAAEPQPSRGERSTT
jgi:hypothetical protein